MADWLNKILIKAKETFNLEDKDVQKIEEQIGTVEMTGVKNTADTKVLAKNNGNVPMTGFWGNQPPQGEIEGFTLFKSTPQSSQQPQNYVELPNQQAQVEARVNDMARQIQQQNQIKQQTQNMQTAQTDQQTQLPPHVESIVYENGKAIVKMKNGKTHTRDAINGEPGFVKTGESIQERLDRYYDGNYSNKTPQEKAEIMKKYFQQHFAIDEKSITKEEVEKKKEEQLTDFIKLMKNTGFKNEDGKTMGAIIHGLHKDNKVKAYLQGLDFAASLEDAINYTDGMVSNIGMSGDEPEVQNQLLQTGGKASSQWGFQSSYVSSVTENFGFVNDNNAKPVVQMAYSLDATAANSGFKEAIEGSESVEAAVRKDPNVQKQVKAILGDDFEIVAADGDYINACSETICHMINTGNVQGGLELFKKSKNYLGDAHKIAVGETTADYATSGNGSVQDRKDAAELAVLATVSIDDKDKQLNVATVNTQKMAQAEEEIKKAYLTANGENLGAYDAENQLIVDAQFREIDTEDETYNVTAAQYGHLVAAENQKEFVQRTTDSGNEEAINNVAEHAYEYDLSNREDILKMLKETGYESTMKALEEAKQKYESETVNKPDKKAEDKKVDTVEEKPQETVQETTVNETSSKSSSSSTEAISSSKKIEKIVTDVSTNTTQKAKQIKELNTKEQEQAIEKLMENASLPEIKGLILSGLKTEVIGYLLNNFSADNKVKLDSIKYLMTRKEMDQYQELLDENKEQLKEKGIPNFFMRQ